MAKCECIFNVVDQFGQFEYHCQEDIHAGPHYDVDQNYTWGAIQGHDAWSKYRLQQEQDKAVRRGKNLQQFRLGKRK